jgi:hypothetical protein
VPDAPYAQVSLQAPEVSVRGFTTDKKITLANEVFSQGNVAVLTLEQN